MKKFFKLKYLATLAVIVAIGTAILWTDPYQGVTPVSAPPGHTETKSDPVPATNSPIAQPKRLIIPSISVDTDVQPVAQDAQGRMDVPSSWLTTGWFQLGPRPGELGNAVIAGHLDGPRGAPGVFLKLDQLRPGQEIKVIDQQGQTHRFKVNRSQRVSAYAKSLEGIFGSAPQAHLNLITCTGSWSKTQRQYEERLVVYSDVVR